MFTLSTRQVLHVIELMKLNLPHDDVAGTEDARINACLCRRHKMETAIALDDHPFKHAMHVVEVLSHTGHDWKEQQADVLDELELVG
jgi:hypothetical protein